MTTEFEWRVSTAPVPYPEALAEMERRVDAVEKGEAPELYWLLEHPPTYTAGTSADPAELLNAHNIPVFETGRGGRYTYHGPGQRVIYVVSDLRKRERDVRQHVWRLEEWVIRTLAGFGIKGERRESRIGIWVTQEKFPSPRGRGQGRGSDAWSSGSELEIPYLVTSPPSLSLPARGKEDSVEEKIGAIGVRVRKWVAYHGLALNVDPDLAAFKGIVPCGIPDFGVTSLRKLGVKATMQDVDAEFKKRLGDVF